MRAKDTSIEKETRDKKAICSSTTLSTKEWEPAMSAYDEMYLSHAQRSLGSMIDFAVNGCGISLPKTYQTFLRNAIALRFGAGDPAIVAGRSGEELALEIMGDNAFKAVVPDDVPGGIAHSASESIASARWTPSESASPEYWTGWALAFYQWASGYTFEAIERRVSIEHIRSLYSPYHEMDVRHFCEEMDRLAHDAHPQTNLQARRLNAGLSQKQLAQASRVPLRTLQQYEQRQKNINHARADYLEQLARALGCSASDLFERSAESHYEYAVISL